MREGKVMETLMTDLEKTKDVDMDDVRKHFLQARCYGDVLVDFMVDSTLGTIMRGTGVPTASRTLRIPPSDEPTDREPKKGSASVGQVPYIHSGSANTTRSGAPQLIPYMMYHRVHHRIVFTQRGKSLHEIHDPKLMLDVLIHVVRGASLAIHDWADENADLCW
ncbi:hypothetical protein FRB93_002928 [Tulasnella sp. JGI-2019a]|nr:hypothetical protein FRB93_002928 [Tulasnella sp. JGI-2019a]